MQKTKQDHEQKKEELEQQHNQELKQREHKTSLETGTLIAKAKLGKEMSDLYPIHWEKMGKWCVMLRNFQHEINKNRECWHNGESL